MSIEKSMGVQTRSRDKLVLDASDPGFHDDFSALMEEEDGIVQQGELRDCCYAHFTYRESGEFDAWVVGPTERLEARWKLVATEAGLALGSPRGALPWKYFLHQLFLYLRAHESDRVRMYSDTDGFIEHLFEASVVFGTLLKRRSLEETMMPYGDIPSEPRAASPTSIAEPERRRGYRTKVQKWMAVEALCNLEVAARRLGICPSALKSIMSDRGKCRYGEATLARILGMIGYQGE